MPLTKNEISSLIMTAFPDATLELNDTMERQQSLFSKNNF